MARPHFVNRVRLKKQNENQVNNDYGYYKCISIYEHLIFISSLFTRWKRLFWSVTFSINICKIFSFGESTWDTITSDIFPTSSIRILSKVTFMQGSRLTWKIDNASTKAAKNHRSLYCRNFAHAVKWVRFTFWHRREGPFLLKWIIELQIQIQKNWKDTQH